MSLTIDTTSYQSPNHSDRLGADIDMIVLHSGEGTKASDLAELRSDRVPLKNRKSAHYYVDREGHVYELVDPQFAAWHAGVSSWLGRDSASIRDHSIGIETEHRRGQTWPTVQREALKQLCLLLIARYDIPQRMVVAHRWVAPSRREDPTDWPNDQLQSWIASLYSGRNRLGPRKVLGLPIYQRQNGIGPIAGYLGPNDPIEIDVIYPADGTAHLKDARGFVHLDGLE